MFKVVDPGVTSLSLNKKFLSKKSKCGDHQKCLKIAKKFHNFVTKIRFFEFISKISHLKKMMKLVVAIENTSMEL